MRELIEALQILLAYGDVASPTHCEHDTLYINAAVEADEVSDEDLQRLEQLGVLKDEEFGGFISFRYGSS